MPGDSMHTLSRHLLFHVLTLNNMANLTKESELQAIMRGVSSASPLISFCIACLAFILVGAFKADYYSGVLVARWATWSKFTGIAIAVVTEGARAVLLLMTFADFRARNFRGGWLGLVLSVGLVLYDCSSAGAVSALWIGDHAGQTGNIIRDLLVFLVVLSFGIEFRLVLSSPGQKADNVFFENAPKQGHTVISNGKHV